MLLMLFANYTVHRLFVDGNWYEMSFPFVYVRITFIHYYLPKILTEKMLRLRRSIEFTKNRGEKTTGFFHPGIELTPHVIFVEIARNSFGL